MFYGSAHGSLLSDGYASFVFSVLILSEVASLLGAGEWPRPLYRQEKEDSQHQPLHSLRHACHVQETESQPKVSESLVSG